MKKKISACLILLLLGMTACFDDSSEMGNQNVNDISITGLRDTSMLSYNGGKLIVNPQVSGYPEEQLTYAWYMYSQKEAAELAAGLEHGYRERKIADDKTLSYEVNLPSDVYTLVLEVTSKTNGYTKTATMQVNVSTVFSKGYYLLKETPDGSTEVDIYNQNGLRQDLMKELLGAPLPGKPANLCVTQNQCYIDEATQKTDKANMVHVFTEDKEFRSFRTEDMAEVFNRTNLLFEGMSTDEQPFAMIRQAFTICYLSSKGLYAVSPGDSGASSGKFGIPAGNGGSRFVQPGGDPTSSLVYWNAAHHHLDLQDRNGVEPMEYADKLPPAMQETALECMASGVNFVGWEQMVYFLCEDRRNGNRYLYLLANGRDEVTEIRHLDPDLHLAQGQWIAGNALTATVIYSIHDNRLWAYDWNTNQEHEVLLPDRKAGETLTYVSNQYLNVVFWSPHARDNFNHLIVGTQDGDKYTLYIYDSLVGSSPVRAATTVIQGKGKVKSVRYATSTLFDMNDLMSYDTPVFPFSD